jgi:light-regulated signal transduction histidine kinase (bacteriophytochrome)
LEAANKELEAFSYSVSHDLRAPLRAIDGFSQVLLEEYQELVDEKGKNYLQRIRLGAQRMAQLIDDMLNLSRVNRGELNYRAVDLSTMAESVAEELRQSQPDRIVDFKIQKGLSVYGDDRLLRIVLDNLLGNAWKFTSNHPTACIEFGLLPEKERTVFYVRDNGAGFNMKYSDKLFGAFQRLHNTTEFPGTGVGLATVQRIIHRHGGQVWAEGETEKGATFYFTIS